MTHSGTCFMQIMVWGYRNKHLYIAINGTIKVNSKERVSNTKTMFSRPIIFPRTPNALLGRVSHCIMRMYTKDTEASHRAQSI